MHRFFAAGEENGLVRLAEEDARHARSVLRLRPGDTIELFDADNRHLAVLTEVGEKCLCRVTGALPGTEAALRITLFQGLPKADKLELIAQKAVELGADSLVPVAMSRCVVKLNAKDGDKKRERWQKIAREASKQSGRCRVMTVEAPVSFSSMLERFAAFDAVLVPWEDCRGLSLKRFAAAHPDIRTLAVVIGPEGGMSAEEVDRMKERGALPVTLGPRILRTETAGLAAVSALMCLYDEMEDPSGAEGDEQP